MEMNNQNNSLLSPTSMTSFTYSRSASPLMQVYLSPVASVPAPVMVFPSPSPLAFHVVQPSPVRISSPSILQSLVGDWVAYADSRSPGKYANMDEAKAPVKKIEFQEIGVCSVTFSDISSEHQSFEIRQLSDGRLHLSSSTNPSYSFISFGQQSMFGNLQWQNAFDPTHIVSWKLIPDDVLPVPNPQLLNRNSSQNSSIRSVSRGDDGLRLSPHDTSGLSSASSFDDYPPHLSHTDHIQYGDYSRGPTPERDDDDSAELNIKFNFDSKSLKRPQTVPRDSKQNLVNRVEPMVDALIGDLYAKEEEYRANRNGRVGPPVLRGDDVLFIPAKKQISLENVVDFVEAIQSTSTIVAASKVCQKKKKRQKKGFLIYLKFASAQEAHNVLEHVYADFREKMPGVKHAIFEPKSTNTMGREMKAVI